jgi:hypothetical protein
MTRFCAVTAPALLFLYGILRWVDGLNGIRGDGAAWDAGHVAFLGSIGLLAALAVSLYGPVVRAAPERRVIAGAATAAALAGAACFAWVTVGDLSPAVAATAPLPDALRFAGPLLFQLGLLGLLAFRVLDRRLPAWSPLAVLAGYAAIAADLDLLPFAAVLVGTGLAPLALAPAGSHAR